MYTKHRYTTNHKYSQNKGLALIILLFISVLGIQSTYAIQISLENMVATNITATPDPGTDSIWGAHHAFDGNTQTIWEVSGGYSTFGDAATLTWDVNPFSRLILDANQQVDYYTYTITLHSGQTSNYNLNNFSFSYSNGTSNTTVTNYNSLSSNHGGAINYNSETGLVSGTASNQTAAHTVSFDVSSDIKSITLSTPDAEGGQVLGPPYYGNWVLAEVTGTVTAEVSQVPEPSTYALLLGFISFVVIAFKKRIKA